MEKYQKNTKGITLISLVVTIVILIILASVSISMIMNGEIIGKAQLAKEQYSNAKIDEQEKIDSMTKEIDSVVSSRDTSLEELISKVNQMESTINSLQTTIATMQTSSSNITKYFANNTNKFSDISIETGDYICYISPYANGTISAKPSLYVISLGNNNSSYTANCYQMISGGITYTVNVSPRTSTVENGTLSISSSSTQYHQCILIKIDNGHI